MDYFNGTWIVVGIDGTGSEEWRRNLPGGRSHIYKFVQDFGKPIDPKFVKVVFFNGPKEEIAGADSGIIKQVALSFIINMYMELISQQKIKSIGYYNSSTHNPYSEYVRIVLVGHSRGGAIVLDIARDIAIHIKTPVYFMGLFDAVDMSFWIDGGNVENTKFAYHALRGNLLSRKSWGNVGLKGLPAENLKSFFTSHGGIGGSPELHPEMLPITKRLTSDLSCSVDTFGKSMGEYCIEESENSYAWIIQKARSHHLPI